MPGAGLRAESIGHGASGEEGSREVERWEVEQLRVAEIGQRAESKRCKAYGARCTEME